VLSSARLRPEMQYTTLLACPIALAAAIVIVAAALISNDAFARGGQGGHSGSGGQSVRSSGHSDHGFRRRHGFYGDSSLYSTCWQYRYTVAAEGFMRADAQRG